MSIGSQWRYAERSRLLALRLIETKRRLDAGEDSEELDLEGLRLEATLARSLHRWISMVEWGRANEPLRLWVTMTPDHDSVAESIADFVDAITALADAMPREVIHVRLAVFDEVLYDDLAVFGDGTCGEYDFNALTDIRLMARAGEYLERARAH